MTNIMIDIETLGTGPRSAIVAIGAVEFDLYGHELGRTLYHRIDLRTSAADGLLIDAETVIWWMKQSDAARAELTSEDCVSLHHALTDLAQMISGDKTDDETPIVWANGASFDFPILAEAYRTIGKPQPWKFFNERDWRTLRKTLPQVEYLRLGTHHNAIDDAYHQARHLQCVMANMQQTGSIVTDLFPADPAPKSASDILRSIEEMLEELIKHRNDNKNNNIENENSPQRSIGENA